jgi:rRNA-processing protein FCF1
MPAGLAAAPAATVAAPAGWVLVLEGRARDAAAGAGELIAAAGVARVRVLRAPGSGDDAIAGEAASAGGPCLVVTADRELRRRCAAAGAAVAGPGWLLGLL